MEIEDIAAVMEVERLSFTTPWPANAYRRELKENRLAHYFVARRTGPAHRNTSATVLPAPPSQGR
ncbi:MAG TPA: ribosomal-protein-alanine N-acetyltransferase, partial [Chloroflexota bacterium]|nr:ribosomal-protein-alanine N-acetyltransferase [Chloroflexota bacterium]